MEKVPAEPRAEPKHPPAALHPFLILEDPARKLAVCGIDYQTGTPRLEVMENLNQLPNVIPSHLVDVYEVWKADIPRIPVPPNCQLDQIQTRLIDGDVVNISSVRGGLERAKVLILKEKAELFQHVPLKSVVKAMADVHQGFSLNSDGDHENVYAALVIPGEQKEEEELKPSLLVFGTTKQTTGIEYANGIDSSVSYLRTFAASILKELRQNAEKLGIPPVGRDQPITPRQEKGIARLVRKVGSRLRSKEPKTKLEELLERENFRSANAEEIKSHFAALYQELYPEKPVKKVLKPKETVLPSPKEAEIAGIKFEIAHPSFPDGQSWVRTVREGPNLAVVAYSNQGPLKGVGKDNVLRWDGTKLLRWATIEDGEVVHIREHGDENIIVWVSSGKWGKPLELIQLGWGTRQRFPQPYRCLEIRDLVLVSGQPLKDPHCLFVYEGEWHDFAVGMLRVNFANGAEPTNLVSLSGGRIKPPRIGGLFSLSSQVYAVSGLEFTNYYIADLKSERMIPKEVPENLRTTGILATARIGHDFSLAVTNRQSLVGFNVARGLEFKNLIKFPESEGQLHLAVNGPRTLIIQAPTTMESIDQTHFYLFDSTRIKQLQGNDIPFGDLAERPELHGAENLILASIKPPADEEAFFSQIRKKGPLSIVGVLADKTSHGFLVFISDGTIMRIS